MRRAVARNAPSLQGHLCSHTSNNLGDITLLQPLAAESVGKPRACLSCLATLVYRICIRASFQIRMRARASLKGCLAQRPSLRRETLICT